MAQTPTASNANTPRLQTQHLPSSTRSTSAAAPSPSQPSSTTRTPTIPSTALTSQLPQQRQSGFQRADGQDNESWQTHLPPPQTFDLLPPLHEILSRTLASSSASAAGLHGAGHLNGNSSTHEDLVHHHPHPLQTREFPHSQPLELQQLVGAVGEVRRRIARARAAVEALPGVDWDVERVEREIEETKRRVEGMREVLAGLEGEG